MDYKKVPLTCEPSLTGYSVDTNGVIYGKNGIAMKPSTNRTGYKLINFTINGRSKTFSLHRLIAKTFLPNPENKPTVNHKNGIRDDNRVDNLELATSSEQAIHSRDVLNHKPHNDKIHVFRNVSTGEIKIFKSGYDASRELGIKRSEISRVVIGYRNTCRGYQVINLEHGKQVSKDDINKIEIQAKKIRGKTSHQVVQKDSQGNVIHIFKNAYETRKEGFCYQYVAKCCKHGYKYNGFTFEFLKGDYSKGREG